jgi:hypothetical protein
MSKGSHPTKKDIILQIAGELGASRFTPSEFEQIQRRMIGQFGETGKTSAEHIAGVLAEAGMRIVWSPQSDTQGRYEDEFRDLLHFSTLEDAEMCLVRLDELWRKFRKSEEAAAAERVLEVARLGRRRADMIARNSKVEAGKRAEKKEISQWFQIWLDTPDAFFDWLELRKQSAEFQKDFGTADELR